MRLILTSIALCVLFVACTPPKQSNESKAVVSHVSEIAQSLKPVSFENEEKLHVFQYVHAFMLRNDMVSHELVPQALAAVPDFDSLKGCYVLNINQNARFGDGKQITAQDLAFTLKAVACGGIDNMRWGNFENYEEIKVVDELCLEIYPTQRTVQDVYLLTEYPILQQSVYDTAGVVSKFTFKELYHDFDSLATDELKAWCDKMNGNYFGTITKNIKGAGAYNLVAWENDRMILKLKENHWTQGNDNWMDKSFVDEIILKLNTDVTSKTLDLKNGLADVSIGFSSKQAAELQEDTAITNHFDLYKEPVFATTLIAFNLKPELSNRKPFFNDEKVRKAIALALPIQKAIDKLSAGGPIRISSFVSVNKDVHNSNLTPIDLDIKEAARLLSEAGWQDSNANGVLDKNINGELVEMRLDIVLPPHPMFEAITSIFKESLLEIGVEVTLQNGSDWLEILGETRQFDLAFYSITNTPGPSYAYSLVLSESFGNGLNYAGYSNPKIDSLIALADAAFDHEPHKKYLYQIQEILYNELPYIYVTTGRKNILINKRFENVKVSGVEPMVLLNTLKPKN